MNDKEKILFIFIFILIINITISQYLNSNKEIYYLINNYTNYIDIPSIGNIIDIKLDNFYLGIINSNNSNNYYKLNILNDSEQIFFDYQSEFGCLYIYIVNEKNMSFNESNYDFLFCSEGTNNIYSLHKIDVLEKIGKSKNDSIDELNIVINVGYSSFELDKNIDFDYSLKISLRKSEINIFEINSEHKMLCNPEKINKEIYRCLFILINKNDSFQKDKDLIIYSSSTKNDFKMNIYADYINKNEYDNWNINYLSNHIPNINSTYNNNNAEIDFVKIPNLQKDKYIYISIESKNEINIEIITQITKNEEEIKVSEINNLQIYSINNKTNETNVDFNNISINDILVTVVTLYGKANIYLGNDESTDHITDIREKKLMYMINLDSCRNENNCFVKINNLDKNDKYIFYIYYTKKTYNLLNELTYGKSNKIVYNNTKHPIIFYKKIIYSNSPININIQLFNIPDMHLISNNNSIFDINILFSTQKDIYDLKLNYTNIYNYNNTLKRKFDPVLSSANIYLTYNDIKSFNITNEFYVVIFISNNTNIDNIQKIILGSIISQTNDIIYPSERIYYSGQIKNEKKIVYNLKGKENYHLMRLEFSSNSEYINYSVKRTNNNNYMKNDTDLGFVTEKWINGRELLTMYIEKGEDIYLSVFLQNTKNVDIKLTNYIFKYINSDKNSNFNNHIIKQDSLNYDRQNSQVQINELNKVSSSSTIIYYLKVINEKDYIKKESLNTIAITGSKNNLTINGIKNNNNIIFNLNNLLNNNKGYYLNAYSIIIEKNYYIEFISYSGLNIKVKSTIKSPSKATLILSSLIIAGVAILITLIKCIEYCCYRRKYHSTLSILSIVSRSDDDVLIGLNYNVTEDDDLLD